MKKSQEEQIQLAKQFCKMLEKIMIENITANKQTIIKNEPYAFYYDFDGWMKIQKPIGDIFTIYLTPNANV